MKLRVLVVDDSRFYRNRVVEMLSADPDLEVIATAENGAEAVQRVREKRPDVITMDIAMPVMDGITAVREIMKTQPTPILMFSSLTTEGAKATVRPAHGAGIKDLKSYRLVIIGASTGGPAALQTIFAELNADFPLPIIVVQHMPAAFTGPFAQRLNSLCRVRVKEAQNGDVAAPGTVQIAPGGKQLEFERMGSLREKVRDAAAKEQYKPTDDVTFGLFVFVF